MRDGAKMLLHSLYPEKYDYIAELTGRRERIETLETEFKRLLGIIQDAEHDSYCSLCGRTKSLRWQGMAGFPERPIGPPILCGCWKAKATRVIRAALEESDAD